MASRGYTLPQVLRWINRERKLHGESPLKKIPAGRQKSPWACPIAEALDCVVDGTYYSTPFDKHHNIDKNYVIYMCNTLPEYMRAFVADYDAGEITNEDLRG